MTIFEKINFIENHSNYKLEYIIPTKALIIRTEKGIFVDDYLLIKRMFKGNYNNIIVKSRCNK